MDIKRLADIIRRYVAESVSGVSAQIESLERRIDALPVVDKEAISGRIDDLHNKIDEQADKIKGDLRSELFDWALDFKSEHEKKIKDLFEGLNAWMDTVPIFKKDEVIDELKAHIDGLDFDVPEDVLEKIFERQSAVWQLEYERRFSAFLEHAISRIPTPDDVRALDGMTVEMQPDGRTIQFDLGVYGKREIGLPVPFYKGVWSESEGGYCKGDFVTWGGSLWCAERDTEAKPGGPDTGWRLAVKKGRDGADGAAGKIPDDERLTAREVRTLRELLAAHEARK